METIATRSRNNSYALSKLNLPVAVAKFANMRVQRNQVGRQIVFKKRDYDIIFKMAQEGFSRPAIAEILRINVSTFSKMLQIDNKALDALERGYAADLQEMGNVMRAHALDGNIHHMKAYLHVTHGIIVGEDQNKVAGLQINVSMPFQVPSYSPPIEGETSEE